VRIIVDTNIIFSALLHSDGNIGDLLFNSSGVFDFYSCSYMRMEIQKHWQRLKQISGLDDERLEVSYIQVISKLNFINEEIINPEIWVAAENLVKGIDIDDTDFVALTLFLDGYLWTGDKVLYGGLRRLGFKQMFNTAELFNVRLGIG